MIALATSATASGSRRGRVAKIRLERARHHDHDREQQPLDRRVSELVEVGDDHRLAGDQIALAVFESPLRHLHGAADQRDRARALGLAQARAQPHRDERGVGAREEVCEAPLRRTRGRGAVEHERVDEFGVLERRFGGDPVLDRERRDFRRVGAERRLARFFPQVLASPAENPRASAARVTARLALAA